MADIKTHLRELSVAVAIGCLKTKTPISSVFTPIGFMDIACNTVSGNLKSANNILTLSAFNQEHINIINNGISLGKYIYTNFKVTIDDNIIWQGNDTQKDDPVDLVVGKYGFSLKENSFILENMGLYKFLSLLTNIEYPKGLHVFEEFAANEYNSWFEYTWSKLIESKSWSKTYPRYQSSFIVDKPYVYFNLNNGAECRVPTSISTPNQLMIHTNSIIREKVLSKWIFENLKEDKEYLRLKKICSETAGQNMCTLIYDNLDTRNLARLLQLRKFEYFYAKSSNSEVKVLRVPSIYDYAEEIAIDSIEYNVPSSQLNIITTIKNIVTGNTFEIRNECRFSHGQFNGTPEAKMYYGRDGDLSIIYTSI